MGSNNQVVLVLVLLVLAVATDYNCQQSGPSGCLQCYTGFYVSTANNGLCTAGNINCASFTTTGDGSCATCWPGYVPTGGLCCLQGQVAQGSNCVANPNPPAAPTVDYNCATTTSTGCSVCYAGYYVNRVRVCTLGDSSCASFTNLGDGSCSVCVSGYFLAEGDCYPTNPVCYGEDENGCLGCYTGYFYDSSVPYCGINNPLCLTQNSQGQCTSCYPGYSISGISCAVTASGSTGSTTTTTPSTVDLRCLNPLRASPCTTCQAGYYVDASSGVCVAARPQCLTYVLNGPSAGNCITCSPGYNLSSDGTNCIQ